MQDEHTFEIKKLLEICLLSLVLITSATFASAHGGKHSDKFTHLQALQKATKLFDQLISKGKLDQSWELGLENVAISNRMHKGKDEVVVSFRRKDGDPRAVYIFFDSNGKYVGSNFTGQ